MDKFLIDYNVCHVKNYHDNKTARFKTYKDCFISEKLKNGEIWEEFLHKTFEKHITKDSVVLEGGTHIGTHTVKLSKLANLVYCFEPLEPSYKLLNENLILNGCDNVKSFNLGLSNRKTRTKFKWETDSNPGASALIGTDMTFVSSNDSDKPSKRVVNLISIDDLNLSKLDFIKLDVEGYEKRVIQGAVKTIKKCRPLITLECYSSDGKTPTDRHIMNKFRNLLNMGYRFERLEHHTDFLFLP